MRLTRAGSLPPTESPHQILAIYDVIATQLLLRFREWTVGSDNLAVSHANCRSGRRRVERFTRLVRSGFFHLVCVCPVRAHFFFQLFLASLSVSGFVAVDHQQVLHLSSPLSAIPPADKPTTRDFAGIDSSPKVFRR